MLNLLSFRKKKIFTDGCKEYITRDWKREFPYILKNNIKKKRYDKKKKQV